MARVDRTYTGIDVIRLFTRNLDVNERVKVLIFFMALLVPAIEEASERSKFLSLTDILFGLYRGVAKTLVRRLLRLLIPRLNINARITLLSFEPNERDLIISFLRELTRGSIIGQISTFLRAKGLID